MCSSANSAPPRPSGERPEEGRRPSETATLLQPLPGTEGSENATPGEQVALAVRNLSKSYEIYARPLDRLKQTLWRGRRQFYREFWALRAVSFELRRGESMGIIGRNGSGKSTLLQIIAGTLRPTAGEVSVRGRVTALLELGSGFNPEFTGRENVFLNGAILGLANSEIAARFDDIAAFADIGEFLEQPIKTYSTGMVVRLAFAVQALLEPDLLIVDEALAVGDEKFQRKCFAHMEQLQARGASILLVTHALGMVEKYCQRALLLERGALHACRAAREVIDQYHALLYADEQAYLRVLNTAAETSAAPPAAAQVAETPGPAPGAPGPLAGVDECERAGSGQRITTARAQIEQVWLLDAQGARRELFDSGAQVEVGFRLRVCERIPELQGGLRIRTVEGVDAYGASSIYAGNNPCEVPAGARCEFRFRFALRLCAGTYFITLAAAEVTGGGDMRYLDKRSDVLIVRVQERPLSGTGIAQLRAEVDVRVFSPEDHQA